MLYAKKEICKILYDLMQNHLSKLPRYKKFYSNQSFKKKKKNQIFSLFPIVKMNASYREIGRVGNFEADFQQYCCEISIIQVQQKQRKILPWTKIKKFHLVYTEIA